MGWFESVQRSTAQLEGAGPDVEMTQQLTSLAESNAIASEAGSMAAGRVSFPAALDLFVQRRTMAAKVATKAAVIKFLKKREPLVLGQFPAQDPLRDILKDIPLFN